MFDNITNANRRSTLSVVVARLIFLWVMSILAAATILTNISQLLGVTFQVYSSISLFLFLIITAWIGRYAFLKLNSGLYKDKTAVLILLILGFIGAGLSIASRRPDPDDFFYVPNVVYYLNNPAEPMGFTVHFVDGGDEPLSSIAWGNSQPIDYFRGVISNLLSVNFLLIYYLLTKAVVGFLIPFALFLVITHFSENTLDAVFAAGVTVGVLLLQGEIHRTYGNFMFTRAFQGKTLLLSAGIPLFTYATLCYFKRPNFKSWMLLFVTATALVGATSSTLFIIPSLALVLTISIIFVSRRKRLTLKYTLVYFTTLSYLFLWALFILLSPSRAFGAGADLVNIGHATVFNYASLIFDPKNPISLLLLIGGSILAILLARNWQRGFLSSWMVFTVILFYNPWSFQLLNRFISSTYWRMFYVFPYPLVVGVVASAVHFKVRQWPKKRYIVLTAGIFLGLLFLHFPKSSSSIFRYGQSSLGYPGFDINDKEFALALRIINNAPEGTMLAPDAMSGIIVMLDPNYPQVTLGKVGVEYWFDSRGQLEEANQRNAARYFIEGTGDNSEAFRSVIERSKIQSVVISNKTLAVTNAIEILEENDFKNNVDLGLLALYWRDAQFQND